jgi:hypothetical protein
MEKKKEKFWMGHKPKCDFCGIDPMVFVDGKVKGISSWAIMCPDCFNQFGVNLGVGKGQMYEKDKEGKFILIAGGSDYEKEVRIR